MKISNEIRKKIIEAHVENGIPKTDIARIFGVKLPTVYAVLKVFQTEGRIERKLKGGPRRKTINEAHIDFIK